MIKDDYGSVGQVHEVRFADPSVLAVRKKIQAALRELNKESPDISVDALFIGVVGVVASFANTMGVPAKDVNRLIEHFRDGLLDERNASAEERRRAKGPEIGEA